jgi:hypothetical protein
LESWLVDESEKELSWADESRVEEESTTAASGEELEEESTAASGEFGQTQSLYREPSSLQV